MISALHGYPYMGGIRKQCASCRGFGVCLLLNKAGRSAVSSTQRCCRAQNGWSHEEGGGGLLREGGAAAHQHANNCLPVHNPTAFMMSMRSSTSWMLALNSVCSARVNNCKRTTAHRGAVSEAATGVTLRQHAA